MNLRKYNLFCILFISYHYEQNSIYNNFRLIFHTNALSFIKLKSKLNINLILLVCIIFFYSKVQYLMINPCQVY